MTRRSDSALWFVRVAVICLLFCLGLLAAPLRGAEPVEYVIQISVDGLGPPYLQSMIDKGQMPNFKRLQAEGAWTHNARTDFDYTVTLPNHTCMITGRSVMDKTFGTGSMAGHFWTENGEPGSANLHSNRHAYVKSAFDVAHDHGLRTALYASKTKFVVYEQSYNAENGAPDQIGADNGRDKIDTYVNDRNSTAMTARLISEMNSKPCRYSFVHFHDTDSAGHADGWGSESYNKALVAVDGYLGNLFKVLDGPAFKGKAVIILSADHGGRERNHGEKTDPLNYTIPFYVWGAGVAQGKDLYQLNPTTRKDPGASRPDYTADGPAPIRNGDGGNLALKLLGLPAVPESFINSAQDLSVRQP